MELFPQQLSPVVSSVNDKDAVINSWLRLEIDAEELLAFDCYRESYFTAIEESVHKYLGDYMRATLKPEYWPVNAIKKHPSANYMLEFQEAFFQAFKYRKAIGYQTNNQPDPQSALLALCYAALSRAYVAARAANSYPSLDLGEMTKGYRRK